MNCTSWKKSLLQKLAITILKLDYDTEFKNNVPTEKLISELVKINKKNKLYTDDELKKLSTDDIKRTLFWLDKTNKKEDMCKKIKEWFSTHKFRGVDMLISDREAGSYGHKKKDNKIIDKPTEFTIQTIIPKDSPDIFKEYKKEIQKLMNNFFVNYKLEIDKEWTLIFKKKKIISIFTNNKNIITNLCFGDYKIEIKKKAMNYVFTNICTTKNPKLVILNKENNYEKLIKTYKECGFKIISKDEDNTSMEFKCNKK
jgi:hypothetical protein